MISGIELAKSGVKSLLDNVNNDVILRLLDENYKNFASFNANKNNEAYVVSIDEDVNLNERNNIMALQTFENLDDLIWHRRLGHFYNSDLHGYLKFHEAEQNLCDDCKISKMKRKPHNKITPKAKDILETIHSDIIGPINESFTGKRYILTIIDEFSRKGWLFLLEKKSDATEFIIDTLKYLMNVYDNKHIKYFKSDNAKEYRNKKLHNFCKQNGIVKIYSPPYNPENNGLAERYNQTIISCTKTLLYWSGLSDNLWDYAVIYANYIYNRVPHSSINNQIPNEIFYNTKTKINHLRVFGCIAYYKNFDQRKNKFTPNSKKGIFLGFSERTNCYLVMDYDDHCVHKVREVHCLEDTPSEVKISNAHKNRFSGKNFLDFDFNFSNENNKDFVEKTEGKVHGQNNGNQEILITNTQNNFENIEDKSKDIKNKQESIPEENNKGQYYNDDITTDTQENNKNKNLDDEKNFNNKNLQNFEQKIDTNNNNNLSSSSQTLNDNKINENHNNLDYESHTLINNKNNENHFNLRYKSQTLNNNNLDNNNNLLINNNESNILNDNNIHLTPNTSDINNIPNSNSNNNNNILQNNTHNIPNSNSNINNNILQNNTHNIPNNISPIKNYQDIDRILNNNIDNPITPNVNKGRSNIKNLVIKENLNNSENVSKIRKLITQNRFKLFSNNNSPKFKGNFNGNINKIKLSSHRNKINKNKNNKITNYKNKEHVLHKTIIKNNSFKHKNYFNKNSKHS